MLSEIENVRLCETVAVTDTWSSFKILTVADPVSPKVPETATLYDAAVVALIEFALVYEMITLSLAASAAVPTPSVGAVRVNTLFCVPENTAPQAVVEGEAARVSDDSAPVDAPCVKVTVHIVFDVKLKSDGNVMIIVAPAADVPVGVVNLIV